MTQNTLSRRRFTAGLAAGLFTGLAAPAGAAEPPSPAADRRLARLAEGYYQGKLALFPVAATEDVGDPAFEGRFEIEIAPAHIARQKRFYERTRAALGRISPERLTAQDRLTHALLGYELRDRLALLAYPAHLMPVTHMDSMPVRIAQYASGKAAQPLKTTANYENFLNRLRGLPGWIDQAIANMEQGMARGITLPRPLVERTLPQIEALLPPDPAASPYLAGVREFPDTVPAADRQRLLAAYEAVVARAVTPAVRRLRDFIAQRYVAAARTTAGIGALPGGPGWYPLLVRASTTTAMSPQEIHALGLREVERIRGEMEQVKTRFGFTGGLNEFFQSLDGRPELKPFADEAQVLGAYQALHERVKAGLPALFERAPKAPLDVRIVEPIRRATASDHYVPPAADGSRPGAFYAVVMDPSAYRTTQMAALYLHEGQPGHHYQIALQQELPVPRFRKAGWYDAFGEGWALYAESLGRELGLYDDPNAYLGRLFMELHRALRLVVDTGLHDKGWSREQTIAYLREKEGSSEDSARRATERYMAWPGQALAYKVGELKIMQLRERARAALGARFDIRAFHSQVLDDGCLPLSMLEAKIDRWIAQAAARG